MTNTMFDAREALIAPGMYASRSMVPPPHPHMEPGLMEAYYRTHDRINFFPPAGGAGARNAFAANIPIPMGMFLPTMPPPTYQFNHQQAMGIRAGQSQRQRMSGPRSQGAGKGYQQNNRANNASQDLSQGPLSQGPLSQGPLTQGGMSQPNPLSQPLSQPELSQDSYIGEDFQLKSQADQALSQDSTYAAGERGGYHPFQSQNDFSQPIYNSQY